VDAKRAFTIWELLAVIIIVALLMALLMPALHRARRISTDVICQSYLRQYGVAGLCYLEDNDGFFPQPATEWLYTKASVTQDHPLACRWHDQAMAPGGEIMSSSPQYKGKMWPYVG
jgi:prepilin-type N-terminal cleavage/methylation domain-containing protein